MVESMNKAIGFTALLMALALPIAVAANADEGGHARSVSDVVSEIAAAQNVNSQDDIRCDSVTDEQFEELGDAVMQAMVGDDEQHELMDNMMGGEGSESLQSMHIGMGQRYLACAQGQFGTMGMMGGMMSMMGGGLRGSERFMTGSSYSPWGMMSGNWGAGMLLFWIVVIVGIGLFIAWLARNQNAGSRGKSALDILGERYAKGEIDQKEFEEKKKDLSS
jgi:uncharacterized membrane protein